MCYILYAEEITNKKEEKIKNRIDVKEIPEDFEWKEDMAVVVHENGWFKADMTCTTKNRKVALNRFFKAIPELAYWREALENSSRGDDFLLGCGEKILFRPLPMKWT